MYPLVAVDGNSEFACLGSEVAERFQGSVQGQLIEAIEKTITAEAIEKVSKIIRKYFQGNLCSKKADNALDTLRLYSFFFPKALSKQAPRPERTISKMNFERFCYYCRQKASVCDCACRQTAGQCTVHEKLKLSGLLLMWQNRGDKCLLLCGLLCARHAK